MKLPKPESAVANLEKLRSYCLSRDNPRGRHKARVFASRLGLRSDNAEELRDALLAAARNNDAAPAERDDYGQRYVLDFNLTGPAGRALVRSHWIVRRGEDYPRLTTCYVV